MTRKQKKMLFRIISAAVIMIALNFIPADGIVLFLLYLIPYLIVGYDILADAFFGIINGQVFDENFLMSIATVGAMILGLVRTGEYTEATAVMLFYQIGELFQSIAVGKSRKNITALMDIRPDYANIEADGLLTQVSPEDVETGTEITVCPGEKVPIDGIVTEGVSSLNTSALTGESLPRDVREGDEIISGCVNLTGVLKIRTTKEFGESTVSKILELVENASSRKSRTEAFITRFARIYTPAVCLSALLLAVVPPLARIFFLNTTGEWGEWLYRALTFLVISCPCALVVSIPLTFFAGIGGAGKEGILVKGSNYLEVLSKTGIVVFDKTGTLTKGVFSVTEVQSVSFTSEQLLDYAAHAESYSPHPIAESLRKAYGKEIDRSRVEDYREISGNGISAKVDGIGFLLGNESLMKKYGIEYGESSADGTVIHIACEDKYAGYILISDIIKENAPKAIEALGKQGITKTVLLTGDTPTCAEKTASILGITEYRGGLLPADKVSEVEKLLDIKRKDEHLAFAGDGINDAPVLSRADVGIAMGALGSDAAIEAADVVLMDDDPMKIAEAVSISRKCMRIVWQNIIFSIGVKIVCLILGAVGAANMWTAIFADVGVMVLAVLNAIRALFVKNIRGE